MLVGIETPLGKVVNKSVESFRSIRVLFIKLAHRQGLEFAFFVAELTELLRPLLVTVIAHHVPRMHVDRMAECVLTYFLEVLAPLIILIHHVKSHSQPRTHTRLPGHRAAHPRDGMVITLQGAGNIGAQASAAGKDAEKVARVGLVQATGLGHLWFLC